jgi:hypothetical protein
MCEKAQEIQKLESNIIDTKSFYNSEFGTIWLPRQDQLQAICTPNINAHAILPSFYDFALSEYSKDKNRKSTLEQLWLFFTMKEKFEKVWDFENKDWFHILDLDTLKK